MNELNKRTITSFILIIVLASMYFNYYIFILFIIVISLIILLELNNLFLKFFKNKFERILTNFVALIYLFYFSWFSINAFQTYNFKIFWLYSIAICIVSDIGGYVFGKFFKGRKLTKISPNKTLSGVIGAFIFSQLLMIIYFFIIDNISFFECIIIAFTASSISQIGDLFISYLKRKAKVKNTSELLPGHGGLLDRVDGIIFGAPVGFNLFLIFYL